MNYLRVGGISELLYKPISNKLIALVHEIHLDKALFRKGTIDLISTSSGLL